MRGLLQAEGALTFLDRLHRQLGEAVPEDPLRAELVRLWWLRRRRPRANVTGEVAGAGHVAHLVQEVVCQKMDPNWRESYACGVAGVAWDGAGQQRGGMHEQRAADAPVAAPDGEPGVAGPEASVLELPRVSRGETTPACPYELLGLKLPSYRFWDLLGMPTTAEESGLTSKSVKFQTYDLGRSLQLWT